MPEKNTTPDIEAETLADTRALLNKVPAELLIEACKARQLAVGDLHVDHTAPTIEQIVEAFKEYGIPAPILPVLAEELSTRQVRELFAAIEKTPPKRLGEPEPKAEAAVPDGQIGEAEIQWLVDHLTEESLSEIIRRRGSEREMAYWRKAGVKASTHVVVLDYVHCIVNGQRTELKPYDEAGQPVAMPIDLFDEKTLKNLRDRQLVGTPGVDRSKRALPSANIGQPAVS